MWKIFKQQFVEIRDLSQKFFRIIILVQKTMILCKRPMVCLCFCLGWPNFIAVYCFDVNSLYASNCQMFTCLVQKVSKSFTDELDVNEVSKETGNAVEATMGRLICQFDES